MFFGIITSSCIVMFFVKYLVFFILDNYFSLKTSCLLNIFVENLCCVGLDLNLLFCEFSVM